MLGGQFAAAAADNHSAITRHSSDLRAELRHGSNKVGFAPTLQFFPPSWFLQRPVVSHCSGPK